MLPPNNKQNAAEALTYANDASEKASDDSSDKYIILTFDDGWSSQYEAYKQLKQYNFKGTLYIISSLVGKEDRLTLDDLKALYNDGWDICNHTADHVDLTKVSAKEAYDEIYACSEWLIDNGFIRNSGYKHFAYPEGAYNNDVINILKEQGFLTARTVNPGSDTSNLLELGRASLYGMDKESIRDLILSNQKLIILSMHRIVPDDSVEISTIDLKQSYFDEVLSSIIDSKRKVITLTEWYEMRNII
jgi:peptidoglycan/xylan/chitin deacetylase (PgdA/CDA1 family)